MIHGFIDGYSRLITGLRASNNNRGGTVLDVFLEAAGQYGVPSRLRGDHGVENLLVAAWMEQYVGEMRGSYIWGRCVQILTFLISSRLLMVKIGNNRSVHNVRIERLWVDVGVQVTVTWGDHFSRLELQYGLDINNPSHIWLLHHLFLPTLNSQLSFFADAWNQHRIQIRNGPNRSPADMFGFDMLANGVRGYRLPIEFGGETPQFPHHSLPNLPTSSQSTSSTSEAGESLPDEEIEIFGVDWEALDDNTVRQNIMANNISNGDGSSWIRRNGPPAQLGGIELDGPEQPLTQHQIEQLNNAVSGWVGYVDIESIINLWVQGLSYARYLNTSLF